MPVFIVDKPLGVTSHDVVARTRKLLKTKRVGHAGTLDPLATGILVILTEDATKLSPFLTNATKRYLAWVSFGAATPTLDAEGPIEATADATSVTAERIKAALPAFLALSEQVPPQYSAIKKAGVKGYEAARKGERLVLEARPAGYHRIELLGFAPSRTPLETAFMPTGAGDWIMADAGYTPELPEPLGVFPTALLDVTVQAGTYVRSFARDLGAALNVPAHLSGLVRTNSGNHSLLHAIQLEDIASATGKRKRDALPYPLIELTDEQVRRVRLGQRLPLQLECRSGLVDASGGLVAVAESVDGRMQYLRVWAE